MSKVGAFSNISNEEIYGNIIESIIGLYKINSYIDMSLKEFHEYVLELIKKYRIQNPNNNSNIKNELYKYISNDISRLICEKLDKEYLCNIKWSNYPSINLNIIRDLCSYIEKESIDVTSYLCESLLKDEKLNEALRVIVEEGINNPSFAKSLTQTESLFRSVCAEINDISFEEREYESTYKGSVSAYINECKFSVLSAEEEKELALKFQNENLPKQLRKYARDEFIKHNLRLVINIAKRYLGSGMPFEDIIAEGNFGLITAVDKFDPEKGFKFSTFAEWWIRQKIERSIKDNKDIIRIPINTHEKMSKYKKTVNVLTEELGRKPRLEEVAKRLGWTEAVTKDLIMLMPESISLNSVIGEDEESEVGDFIADETAQNPDEVYGEKLEKERFINAFRYGYCLNKNKNLFSDSKGLALTQRDITIIVLRYGFILPKEYDYLMLPNIKYIAGHEYTLEAVGEKLGESTDPKSREITRERIRQIESKTRRKLARILSKSDIDILEKIKIAESYYKSINSELKNYKIDDVKDAILSLSILERNLISDRENYINKMNNSESVANCNWSYSKEKKFQETVIPKLRRKLEKMNASNVGEKTIFETEKDNLTSDFISYLIYGDYNNIDKNLENSFEIFVQSNIFRAICETKKEYEKEIINQRFKKINGAYKTVFEIASTFNVEPTEIHSRISSIIKEYQDQLEVLIIKQKSKKMI